MNTNTLDIIIPCFNPLDGWHHLVVDSYSCLRKELPSLTLRIILVNDGSLTGIEKSQIDFLNKKIENFLYLNSDINYGKGFAIRKGFENSTSKYTIFTDIDFPYREDNIIEMVQSLKNGADIVVGIRNEDYYKKVPKFRKLISVLFKKLIKLIFRIPTIDTQAGLKAFSLKGKNIALRTTTNRYLFDLELIKRASKNKNLKFSFVSIQLKDNIILSKITFSILFKEFKNLIKILFL